MENIKEEKVIKTSDLIEAGFIYDSEDPECPYKYNLLGPDEDEEEMTMFLGAFGAYSNFYLCIDGNFIHLNVSTIEEALDWGSKIASYQPNF